MIIIKEDFCLAPFNTFGLEVLAYELVMITSTEVLHELFKEGKLKENILVLSKGSNILFTGHFNGLVLLNQLWGKEVIVENDETILLKVNAGEFWPSLVEYTVENGWGGIENMTDIPGKVGAAPIQNIGAYGTELKDVMVSLEAFNFNTGIIETFTNEDCKFGYRSSIFKNDHMHKYFITSVVFKLTKNPTVNLSYKPLAEAFKHKHISEVTIAEVSAKVAEIRASKLPNPEKLKNAGSFFKNPVIDMAQFHNLKLKYETIPNYPQKDSTYKIPAGWLIEQCGLKGKRDGDVGVHEKQALVIVNYGDATGYDILKFANYIKDKVFEKFKVRLEFEVNVI